MPSNEKKFSRHSITLNGLCWFARGKYRAPDQNQGNPEGNMRSEKSRHLFWTASAMAAIFAAAAMLLSVGGCNNSPTGPADTSEILLVYPKGGESFKIGDSLHVKWTEQG